MNKAACIAVCIAGLAGCAGSGRLQPSLEGPGWARTPAGQSLAPQAAMATVTIGSSTKPDVAAALGKAITIRFDSGYEVWVYRWPGAERTTRAATELVLLFDPAGLAAKVRLRPGYATRDPSD